MYRPTLKELITGLQGTIAQNLLPELSSPYAQNQAMSLVGMLSHAANAIEKEAAFDNAELKDLRATIATLGRLAAKHLGRGLGDLKKAAARGAKASVKNPPDRREMEAAISEFVTAVALKRVDDAIAKIVRGYVRRHLERSSSFLGGMVPGAS